MSIFLVGLALFPTTRDFLPRYMAGGLLLAAVGAAVMVVAGWVVGALGREAAPSSTARSS